MLTLKLAAEPLRDDGTAQANGALVGGAAMLGGGAAGAHSLHSGALTGRTRLFHGTRKDLHANILEKGLQPSAAPGAQKGISEILGDRVPTAKELVYTTGNKQTARGYAVQADSVKHVVNDWTARHAKNPDEYYDVVRGIENARAKMNLGHVLNPLNNGGILEARVPLWKKEYADKLTQNPEARASLKEYKDAQGFMGAFKPDAVHKAERAHFLENKVFKGGLGPEVFKNSPQYQKNSLKEVMEYAKAKPGRFAGGALLAAGGLGAMGYGAHRMYKAFNPDTPKTAAACFEELAKIGAVSDDQAHAALNRYETLERNKPTGKQVGRYAGLGAVAGVGIGALGDAISGKSHGGGNGLRGHLARAATGALTSGAVPLVRGHLDRQAEKKTLQGYLAERGVNTAHSGAPTGGKLADAFEPVEKAAASTGVTPSRRFSPDIPVMLALGSGEPEDTDEDVQREKNAFTTSQYSGGPGYPTVPQRSGIPGFRPAMLGALIEKKAAGAPTAGGFLMASEMPAFRAPSLQRVAQGQPQAIVEKLGGVATTPAGILARAKGVGAPKTTGFAGPSIASISKPPGMGHAMPGALKNAL